MKTSTDIAHLSDVLSHCLQQFPPKQDLALPELTGAPPFSPNDSLRFGVIAIGDGDGDGRTLTVRRNLIGESLDNITKTSLLLLKPRLEVEDPEGEKARRNGFYGVRCIGWEVVLGKIGTDEQRASVNEIVSSVLRNVNT
jgi:hypothetical protein